MKSKIYIKAKLEWVVDLLSAGGAQEALDRLATIGDLTVIGVEEVTRCKSKGSENSVLVLEAPSCQVTHPVKYA